jgi:hypothetical protein
MSVASVLEKVHTPCMSMYLSEDVESEEAPMMNAKRNTVYTGKSN